MYSFWSLWWLQMAEPFLPKKQLDFKQEEVYNNIKRIGGNRKF